jgi:methylamine--corrinoid protein Co-methyltransferase
LISLLEVAERARSGPKMDVKDWDLGFFRKMEELKKRHRLDCSGDAASFNLNSDLADRAYEAAVDFLSEMGAYCISSGRAIRFTGEEVREAVRDAPSEFIVGEGRDARLIRKRVVEDRRPTNVIGGLHAPYSEDLSWIVPKNFAQVPRSDIIEGFNTTTTDGREIYGLPIEAYAGRRELAWMREGVRKAGRPGMAICYYPISTRASTLIAPMDPEYGLRRTDGILLSILPDIKVEYDLLTAAIVYQDYGAFRENGGGGASIGGFCGGPEGAVVEAIAKCIAAWMVYRDLLHNVGVSRLALGRDVAGTPCVLQTSTVHEALCRNTNLIVFGGVGTGGVGPGSEMCLREKALSAFVSTITGSNIYIPRAYRPNLNEGQTPLEVEFMVEVSDATLKSGIRRKEAGQILKKMCWRYIGKPIPPSRSIRECYDLIRHRPSGEYEEIYKLVKSDLAGMGLRFD